jgi:hypothetical protein
MLSKNIISIITTVLAFSTLWYFSLPFNEQVILPLQDELSSIEDARDRYQTQINIPALEAKITNLSTDQKRVLESYIPRELRSGRLVYTIAQLAQQNRLDLKGVQYSVVDSNNKEVGQKLTMEFQVEGFYENVVAWIKAVELSDTLVDVESLKAGKVNNVSDIVAFTVKMSAYGVRID